MKTLKTSRNFFGSPISFRAVSTLEGRKAPVSLRDFVASMNFRDFSGQLSTGDVTCTWRMAVWQNGFWSLRADFHDGGILGGDFFSAEFVLDKGVPVGTRLKGSILDPINDRDTSMALDGSDPLVRENWHKFEASGPSVSLHAAPAVGMIIENSILLLGIAVFAVIGVDVGVTRVKSFGRRRSASNFDTSSPPPDAQASIDVGEEEDLRA